MIKTQTHQSLDCFSYTTPKAVNESQSELKVETISKKLDVVVQSQGILSQSPEVLLFEQTILLA